MIHDVRNVRHTADLHLIGGNNRGKAFLQGFLNNSDNSRHYTAQICDALNDIDLEMLGQLGDDH